MRPSNNSYVAAMAHRIVKTEDFPTATSSVYLGKNLIQERLRLKAFLILWDEARGVLQKSWFRQLFWGQRITLEELVTASITWVNPL